MSADQAQDLNTEFVPHSEKQESAIFSRFDITVCCTGLQWGKTTVGARWLRDLVFQHYSPYNNFIVTAPTYKIMSQSTLPEFLKVFDGFGRLNKAEASFKLYDGPTIYLRTGTDPDSIVGITNVMGIWGDEAGKYSLYFWQNIEGRAALKGCPIMLTTTPYSLNWLYKEIVKPVKEGKRNDIMLVSAKSIENPHFSAESYQKRKATMDPRQFRAMYDGQFERLAGIVYDCYDERLHMIDEITPEAYRSLRYYAGIDWGYTDPFAFLIVGISDQGIRFVISETYRTGLIPTQIVDIIKGKMVFFNIEQIYCDPSRPDMIRYLCENKIPAMAGENDIMTGVGEVYKTLKEQRLLFLKGAAPHTLDEIETYHYPEPKDLKPDQHQAKEKPVDQTNHACVAAGTLITTIKGDIKIELIKAGEYVLTRSGFKRVVKTFDNGMRSAISLGTLSCTPDHLILTDTGWIQAKYLTEDSVICEKRNGIMALVILGINILKTYLTEHISKKQVTFCTGLYGKITMGLSLIKCMYITKTAIRAIIGLKILSLSMLKNTYRPIKRNFGQILSLGKKGLNIYTMLKTRPLSGTGAARARNGIGIITIDHLQRLRQENSSANIVEHATKQKNTKLGKWGQNFAQMFVRAEKGEKTELITSSAFAKFVKASSSRINMQNQKHVVQNVLRVYDLEIEEEHEYFANGILVHNCDALRYVIMGTRYNDKQRKPFVPVYEPKKPDGRMPHEIIRDIKRKPKRTREKWS